MGDEAFDGQALTEKLSKLNSSQQSIESLSRWCTSFRKKAKQIVETWDKLFKSAQKEQRVAFLYLANDILQNSRRKGSEFVNEFWKVLPAALKHVYESGHESGKKAASRLVDIWEERKVFGSRGQILKDEVLGKNPSLPVSNGKNPNPVKVIKRDAHSLRIKLAVGDIPEKIITAFQVVHDENTNEKGALNKCKDALSYFKEMEKDIANISSNGTPQGSEMVDKIQEQENILQQCISQLENVEATRVALISQLKEAVQDQESKLELLRSDMKAAHIQIEQAANLRKRLTSPFLPIEAAEQNPSSAQLASMVPLPTNPVTSFASSKPTDEENKKAMASAVVAKLTASTSSAQMLTSVLSSLVAEEAAASMSSGLKRGYSSNLPYASPEKRPKLENPTTFSDMNKSDGGGSSTAYFSSSLSQTNPMSAAFPPPPPPPPIPPANSPQSQLVQSAAMNMMMGVLPYGYGSAGSLPPPPMPIATGLTRPPPPLQPPQQQQIPQNHSQQQQQQQQQQPVSGGFYPPGFGFYGQSPQTTPPPVPRQ